MLVLIPCSGIGTRFGSNIPKQYAPLLAATVLAHTLKPFIESDSIKQIILVAKKTDDYINNYLSLSNKITIKKVGGITRAESVLNGLLELKCSDSEWILVHDAVRCCITSKLLNKLITALKDNPVGGILAIKATDTVKKTSNYGKTRQIDKTVDREDIYLAQTPQMFRYGILLHALKNIDLTLVTDDASAIEQLGLKVEIVESDPSNFKITHPLDLQIANLILTENKENAGI